MFLTNALTLVAVIGLPVPFPQPTPVVGVIKLFWRKSRFPQN